MGAAYYIGSRALKTFGDQAGLCPLMNHKCSGGRLAKLAREGQRQCLTREEKYKMLLVQRNNRKLQLAK